MNEPVIGQTAFVARAWSYGDQLVPCPVCYGQLFATLILGNGEQVKVECDSCGIGFDGPRGVINAPCAGSRVDTFVIAGVLQDGDGWKALDHRGSASKWGEEAFATYLEADARRMVLYHEAVRDAEDRRFRQAAHKRKGTTWLVRYHREKIKTAERELEYHTRKLSDALSRERRPAPLKKINDLIDMEADEIEGGNYSGVQ